MHDILRVLAARGPCDFEALITAEPFTHVTVGAFVQALSRGIAHGTISLSRPNPVTMWRITDRGERLLLRESMKVPRGP
jgi:hypothetical protein